MRNCINDILPFRILHLLHCFNPNIFNVDNYSTIYPYYNYGTYGTPVPHHIEIEIFVLDNEAWDAFEIIKKLIIGNMK